MTARKTLLFAALAAALFAATPAFAQDTPPPDTEVDDASVTKDRLVDEYADTLFGGDEVAAADTVSALRTGGDFTLTTTETRQVLNADGTPATNPDGSPKMETVTVETLVENPNGPMGWGEVDHSLGMADALVEKGEATGVEEALMGTPITTTVTNPDGTTTTTTTYEGGILQMRADGMGWGKIAKELGFKSLGEIKGNGKNADTDATTTEATASAEQSGKGKAVAKSDHANQGKSDTAKDKVEHAANADRATGKPDRVAKVDRPSRPDKLDRPQRPERPERPSKPERGRP